MRKIISMAVLVCLCVLCLLPVGVSSANINILVDGAAQTFATPAVILEGRTLVSAEEFFAVLGAKYSYDEEDKTVFAENNDYSVELVLDEKSGLGTRMKYDVDVPAQNINGVVMVPLRFIAEQMGYNVGWDDSLRSVVVNKIKYTSAVPENEGVKAALARGRQLTEFRFTPLKPMPMANTKEKMWFEAGKEYKGFAYSSTEKNNKFLGENVSFESYLTALANPDSALYTKDMFDYSNAYTYFGLVCNGFVRFCFGIELRYNTATWANIDGMNLMYGPKEYKASDLKLCDVLRKEGHVAMISNLLYNENGKVERVEVSESMHPLCRRRIFTLKEFYAEYGDIYSIFRYEHLASVPAFDEEQDKILKSGIDKVAPVIAVDYGNKSNYIEGEETVISVFAEGDNTVQIIRDGKVVEEVPVSGYTKITRKLEKGYYVVKLANTEDSTEFCVCYPVISHTVENNKITIKADSGDSESKLIHMEFRKYGDSPVTGLINHIILTDEEIAAGSATRDIPANAGYYKVYFKNKYGIWTLDRFSIK